MRLICNMLTNEVDIVVRFCVYLITLDQILVTITYILKDTNTMQLDVSHMTGKIP